MKNTQQLLAEITSQGGNESSIINAIKQHLLSGNLQQHQLQECLHEMHLAKSISDTLYEALTTFIQTSNANTVVVDDDKTLLVTPDKAQFDADLTQIKADSNIDKTQLASKHTDLAKTRVANETTRSDQQPMPCEEPLETELDPNQIATQINTQSNVNEAESLAGQKLQSDSNAATVIAGQQTYHERTQQTDSQRTDTPPGKLGPGAIIRDRFILKKVIGSGGMSVVFRALDLRKQEAKNQNPYVAIKVLGDTFKHHPLSLLALERETQKIQSLAHPNIITVYDFDRDGENIYMTMECLEGQSLDEVIRQHKQGMPFSEAKPIIEGMCQALIYAHSKNIIHSDLKPENVYYTNKKETKVLDFGIARAKKTSDNKAVDTVFDAGSLSALTPPYASLEMLQNKDPDPKDDIFALACVTYKLLTGKHPYKNMQADIAQKNGLQAERITSLNRRQWQTLSNGLAFSAKNRTQNVEEFLDGIMPKKRGWIYALAASIILAIGLSGYLGTSITEKNTIPKIKLTVEQENKIKNYLEIADLYFSLGYLATPPGDSALDQYIKVLEIDPGNKAAIEGKKKLVERYQQLAAESLKQKAFEESLQLLDTALLIDPENEALLSQEAKVQKLRAEFD